MVMRAARLAEPYVASVAIVGPQERYTQLDLRILPDRWSGVSPLGEIATALARRVRSGTSFSDVTCHT